MRSLAVLALGLAFAMAGCFGGDDSGSGDDTNPTPVGSTPAPTGTGTGTGMDNGTGTGTGNGTGTGTTPPPTPPKDLCTVSVNFAEGAPTPPAPAARSLPCGAVTAGYKTLVLNVTWTTTGPIVAQNGINVWVLDAAGSVVATCAGPASGPAPAAPAPCTNEGPIPAPGDYTVQADGTGNVAAAITVSIR